MGRHLGPYFSKMDMVCIYIYICIYVYIMCIYIYYKIIYIIKLYIYSYIYNKKGGVHKWGYPKMLGL